MKKTIPLSLFIFVILLFPPRPAEILATSHVEYRDCSNAFFRPSLDHLKTAATPTHLILSGYLRKSMTLKIYPKLMAHFGIEGQFLPYELPLNNMTVDREALFQFLTIFRNNPNLKTFIVSDPYKQVMPDYVDELTPIASTIRTVNLVYKKEGKLIGDNIEARAFLLGAKEEVDFVYEGHSMLFFGCGGVSSALAYALSPQLKRIGLVDIDPKKQQYLAETLQKLSPATQVIVFDRQKPLDCSSFDILYNGTGLGKFSKDPDAVMHTPIQEGDILPSHGLAIDANYTPWQTHFLIQLTEQGMDTLNGYSHMLASTTIHLSMISNKNIEYAAVKKIVSSSD